MRTSTVEIKTAEAAMPAHLAEPEGQGPFPGVVVIMEAFGLLPHICDVANRLADEGYVALAPDFYYRDLPDNKAGYDQLERAITLMQRVDDEKFLDDMRATLSFLRARENVESRKLGVTGFCMGGRLSFLTACALPDEIAACAPFYGGGIVNHLPQADRMRCPITLFFGEEDPYIPMDQVIQIDARLKELGKSYQLKTYPGANHGFFCSERTAYQAAAARDAWTTLLSFFSRNLQG